MSTNFNIKCFEFNSFARDTNQMHETEWFKKNKQTPEQYACSFHQLLRTRQEHYTRKYSLFFTRKQDKKVTTYSGCLSVRCFPV